MKTGISKLHWSWPQISLVIRKDQDVSFEFISADGYYGNDASFARFIDRKQIFLIANNISTCDNI
jgi:hypothetical protein